MDLIASIISWVLAFCASVLGNILAHDICARTDTACGKIIHRASRRLAAFECIPVEQEWLADLHERETVFEKYRHSIGCFLAAGKMRRQAEVVKLVVQLPDRGRWHRPADPEHEFEADTAMFRCGKLPV